MPERLLPAVVITPKTLSRSAKTRGKNADDATGGARYSRSTREHILETLAAAGGSRKLAGERLGMSERTLRHKLKQYREAGFFSD
mgnify:FL=1